MSKTKYDFAMKLRKCSNKKPKEPQIDLGTCKNFQCELQHILWILVDKILQIMKCRISFFKNNQEIPC